MSNTIKEGWFDLDDIEGLLAQLKSLIYENESMESKNIATTLNRIEKSPNELRKLTIYKNPTKIVRKICLNDKTIDPTLFDKVYKYASTIIKNSISDIDPLQSDIVGIIITLQNKDNLKNMVPIRKAIIKYVHSYSNNPKSIQNISSVFSKDDHMLNKNDIFTLSLYIANTKGLLK